MKDMGNVYSLVERASEPAIVCESITEMTHTSTEPAVSSALERPSASPKWNKMRRSTRKSFIISGTLSRASQSLIFKSITTSTDAQGRCCLIVSSDLARCRNSVWPCNRIHHSGVSPLHDLEKRTTRTTKCVPSFVELNVCDLIEREEASAGQKAALLLFAGHYIHCRRKRGICARIRSHSTLCARQCLTAGQ